MTDMTSNWDSVMMSGITAETARANAENYNHAKFRQALLKPAVQKKIREIEQQIDIKSKDGCTHLYVDLDLPLNHYYWRQAIMLNAMAASVLSVPFALLYALLEKKFPILTNPIISISFISITLFICFFFLMRKLYRENNQRKEVGLNSEDWDYITQYFNTNNTNTHKYSAYIIPYHSENIYSARYLWIRW
ncbi:MAG: hypothetical protein IJ780_03605 [Neisseriaceae bacterium]|nr:hypothetical protein [Neisseriaceae bacterium]